MGNKDAVYTPIRAQEEGQLLVSIELETLRSRDHCNNDTLIYVLLCYIFS